MVKILHCADIHLDSAFVCGDARKSVVRKNELYSSFSSMMTYAKNNSVDIVLISGDLFDSENVTRETASLLQREFADNPDCRFVIAPGNHDPFTENSIYSKTDFPPNVFIFKSTNVSHFSFDELNCDVYGYAFTSSCLNYNPFKGVKPQLNSRINIMCAHGDMLSNTSDNCPITVQDIKDSGFDYVALGHIHAGGAVQKTDDTYYAYSGCLEGRDFGECGYKGAILGTFEKEKCELKAEFKPLRFSKRRYEIEKLNISGAKGIADILPALKAVIDLKNYGTDTLLRVILEGDTAPDFVISDSSFQTVAERLFYLEIVNKSRPLFDLSNLENDPTIRGAFYAELKMQLMSEDEEEREKAYAALKYGLSALGGSNVIDF